MEIINCIQGSDEWWEAKLGMVSASNFAKVLNKGSGRKLYMRKLAGQRLTGTYEESYKNKIMEKGNELEPAAREYYEKEKGYTVKQVGFVARDEWVGGSPDGLISPDGGLEIKCVLPSTHIDTILKAKMPTSHIPQVQGLLWVTEQEWWDFISYSPLLKGNPFYCVRVPRDEDYIALLEKEVGRFVNELKDMIEKIAF
jgi:hypothetical protein